MLRSMQPLAIFAIVLLDASFARAERPRRRIRVERNRASSASAKRSAGIFCRRITGPAL